MLNAEQLCIQEEMSCAGMNGLQPSTLAMNCTKKRRMEDGILVDMEVKENLNRIQCQCSQTRPKRKLVAIPCNRGVFHTEETQLKNSTLYLPVTHDILVNTRSIEQWSFSAGSVFVADHTGNYAGSVEGDTLHMWRYDESSKRLYISRSFLFTDKQIYITIRRQLEEL